MFKFGTITVAAILAGVVGSVAGVWLAAVLASLLLAAWVIGRWAYVRVPEMETAVVYNTESKTFARFLPPGRHWIIPFVEQVEATISTAPAAAKDRCDGIHTSGGLSLSVEWSLAFNLNPFKTAAANRPKLARSLPRKAPMIAKKHVNNCLRHIIGEYTIDQLCEPGVYKRLERQARQVVAERLASLGFEISRVMIGAIEMPPHVKAAIEAAHERRVQTENEARALAHLQKVVSQFSDDDMQRLMELERIHALGQNGVTMLYPAAFERSTIKSRTNAYTRLPSRRPMVVPGVS